MTENYKLVRVGNDAYSIHSFAYGETMHPAIGPAAEADALYVQQLEIPKRLAAHKGEFVIWDIGLGGAANALAVLRATQMIAAQIQFISFDNTLAPLQFASTHPQELGYLQGYEAIVAQLASGKGRVEFDNEKQRVCWQVHVADFPTWIERHAAASCHGTAPHVILFDAFSPAKNPAMWTAPLFANLFKALNPQRPCSLATYSRSTMLRIALLLAGFYVGAGHGTGRKEETTVAANTLELIKEPLEPKWLERARKSTSAEPLWEPIYRQAPLSVDTFERLKQHPQFDSLR